MEFRIASTFTDSLARLTGDEQKAVKTTAFDLQMNPVAPGLQFHKLEKARDKDFWSLRVNRDIRLIVHRSEANLLLCYVDHHDKAYGWAERRKVETHPKTGAAQLVEIRETVKEIVVPSYVPAATAVSGIVAKALTPARPLFSGISDEQFLGYGVPAEWLGDVKRATEDSLMDLADHLPAEAAEALLELATGGVPRPQQLRAETVSPFEHPDAQRRFRVMSSVEELERALEAPWDKWTVFLHPEQRTLVEHDWAGSARVAGSAGTGKTIVALHRAAHLARSHPDARVLLTTFSDTLASALRTRLRRLLGNEPRLSERIDVHSLAAIGRRLYDAHVAKPAIVPEEFLRTLMRDASAAVEHKFSQAFLLAEWRHVVDAWQLASWEAYRDVERLGRKTRLSEGQRRILWSIFEAVRARLREKALITEAELFTRLGQAIASRERVLFDYVIADEAQDLSVPHLRFLAALGGARPNALFFAGDLGQRIFQQPFSWKALGVDVRGRSRTLRVNYRTSHQIRAQADRLLGTAVADADGVVEERKGTISVFNGPVPTVLELENEERETEIVSDWLAERVREGFLPHELAVFVRSDAQIERGKGAIARADLECRILDDSVEAVSGFVSLGTMHLAKGLEFRGVTAMACDDEVIPSQERIAAVGDIGDLAEIYDTERHLLYVACTRARDRLLVTGVAPASEFLDDLGYDAR